MSIATRFVSSTARPRLDLSGCVLYAPLWRPDLGGSTFTSIGDGGIPTHLCTVTGASWGIQGRTFDGVGNFISVAHNANLNYTTNATVWFWIKLLANGPANGGYICSKGFFNGAGDNGEYYARTTSGGTTVNWGWRGNSTEEIGGGTYTLNQWTFGSSTYEGGVAVDTYKDMVLVTHDVTVPATLLNTTNPLDIGRLQRGPGDTYPNMVLGEIGGANRTMTLQELWRIYLTTKGRYV